MSNRPPISKIDWLILWFYILVFVGFVIWLGWLLWEWV